MNTHTETKHTPGPWKFSFESIDPEWAVVTNGCITIANVNADSRQKANARLIAAAPELLEALRVVVADWELTVKSGHAIQDSLCTRLAVKSAIAKATEGAQ